MKPEGSPGEAGPVSTADALSGDVHGDENLSDDEPETELEALQHLPPEERRKALRRLRNRESARRVRARRLAEMSQMETAMRGIKEENTALKAHVSKLQSHIQSMTLKVYEVTSKYESAVAENAQLRAELQRFRRPSALGESSLAGPASVSALGTAAGPSSGPLQPSPLVGPNEELDMLTVGHAQLRSSSPMDLQQQRQALEEVVMLLKEHKRRSQLVTQDRSVGSEIGSSGAANNAAASNLTNAHSPGSDVGPTCIMPIFGGASCVAPASGTTNVNGGGLSYNGSGVAHDLGPYAMMGGRALRSTQMDPLMGPAPAHHLQQQQQQPPSMPQAACLGNPSLCHLSLSNSNNGSQLPPLSQVQQMHQQLLAAKQQQGPVSGGSLSGVPAYSQQQPQQPLAQSHSHPLTQLQLAHHQQLAAHQQYQLQPGGMQTVGSSVAYNSVSSLSAPFLSAGSAMPCNGLGQALQGPVSGPDAYMCIGPASGDPLSGQGCVMGGSSHHKSASYAMDRGSGLAYQGLPAGTGAGVHTTWQVNLAPNPANGAANMAGVGMLRPEDIADDIFMSFDEYVPQDL